MGNNQTWNRREGILAVTGGLLLLLAGWMATHGLRSAMDIFFLDETGYLTRGMNMFPKIPKLWGPVYCFWYKLLSFVQSDPVALFYLNFGLMTVALAVATYLFLIRFRVLWPVALWLALLVLLSPVNVTTFPRVSHFTTVAAMVALMAAYGIRHHLNRYVFMALSFLVLAYVRPEFYLSFLITAVGLAGLVAGKRVKAEPTALVLGGLVAAVLLHIGLGFPLGVELRGYKRSFIAFGEHFAYNYSLWNHLDGYYWLIWEDVVGQFFGDSKSFSEALLANPAMMFRHFLSNASRYGNVLGETLVALFLPVKQAPGWAGLVLPVLIAASLIHRGVRDRFLGRLRHHRALFLFLFLLALPSMLSCVVIFPRDHYIVNQLPLLVWLLAEWLSAVLRAMLPGERLRYASFIVLAAALVLLAANPPTPADYTYFELRKEEGRLNNQRVLALFDGNREQLEGAVLLSHEGDFTAFTKAGIRFVNAIEKGKRPFAEFLAESDPDMIYCTQTIFKNPDYQRDSTWLAFTEGGAEREGWLKLDVGGGPYDFLLLKRDWYDLLSNNEPR